MKCAYNNVNECNKEMKTNWKWSANSKMKTRKQTKDDDLYS